MQTEELAQAWRAATDDLHIPADFVERVVRGGRRRSVRRRAALAAGGAVVAVTLMAAGITTFSGNGYAVTDERLTAPTGGDLAGDHEFLDAATRLWQEGITVSPNVRRGIFDDPRSDPHVYWAGTTPAGPAAVVLQAFFLHEHGNLGSTDWNEVQTLVGLVGTDPATGESTLLGDQYRPDGFAEPGAFRFGPEDRTVLVVERAMPVYIATHRTFTPEGRGLRNWQPLTFTDGVAVFQVPAEDDPADVRLAERATPPDPGDLGRDIPALFAEVASTYIEAVMTLKVLATEPVAPMEPGLDDLEPDWEAMEELAEQAARNDHRLPWQESTCRALGEPRPTMSAPSMILTDTLWEWGTVDPDHSSGPGQWCIAVGVADGTTILVGEIQEDQDPSRIYALTVDADGAPSRAQIGATVDPSTALPVAIRLDGGHGWVVAAYGNGLAYRTTVDGDWTDAGRDAALLPDDATEVRVADSSGRAVVVPMR